MYKIEINDDTTLEGLLTSFENLKDAGIRGYVEINGEKIYDSDPKLIEKLKNFFSAKQVNENESEKIENDYNNPTDEAIHKQAILWNLSNNVLFTFYLGIALKYIKEEFKEKFKNYYISVYSDNKYEILRDLPLLANILLVLEYKDIFIIQEKLNSLFLNLSPDDIINLDIVILTIKRYGIHGDLIDQCFSTHILDKDLEDAESEIKKLLKKKNK